MRLNWLGIWTVSIGLWACDSSEDGEPDEAGSSNEESESTASDKPEIPEVAEPASTLSDEALPDDPNLGGLKSGFQELWGAIHVGDSGGGASSAQSVKDSRIAELIPADAEMVMVFQNMTDVVEEYEQFLDPKLAGDHEFGNSLREIHQVFQDELGFDLSDGDFWELTGLDLDAPWVIAGQYPGQAGTINIKAEPMVSVLIPLADGERFKTLASAAMLQSGGRLDCEAEGIGEHCKVQETSDSMSVGLTKDYLVIANAGSIMDASGQVSQILSEQTARIQGRSSYAQIYERLPTNWNGFLWISERFLEASMGASSFDAVEDFPTDADELKSGMTALNQQYGGQSGTGLWGLGITASLTSKHVEMQLVTGADWMGQFSQYLSNGGQDALIGKLGGDAFAAIRLSQSMVGLLKAALEEGESAEAWKQTREDLFEQFNVDIQDDILLNLTGDLGIIGYGKGGSPQFPDALVYLGLKEDEKIKQLMQQLSGMAGMMLQDAVTTETVDDNEWILINMEGFHIGIAVAESNLIVTLGKGRAQAVQEALRSDTGDLLEDFGERGARVIQDGPPYVALVHVPRVINTLMKYRELRSALGIPTRSMRELHGRKDLIKTCVGDVLFSGGLSGNAVMAVARVEAGTGGFDGCLEALMAEGR